MISDEVIRFSRVATLLALTACAGLAEDLKPIALPPPQTDGGKPLMQVLKERKSTRAFAPRKLAPQVLSNLLWAAFGVNRPDGRRTAPSANNWQEIEIYVAIAEGLYVFDAKQHTLRPVLAADLRAATGSQDFVRDAPANLIYVADFAKMTNQSPQDQVLYSAADTGFIAENVYLFCASEGLAAVVRATVDRAALVKAIGLRADQRVVLVQSVGYPKQ